MKVRLDRTFAMPGSPEVTWGMLQDIEAVAACMPGAKITERLDETHYKGTVTVKFGPASLAFRGEIEVREQDAATRTLRLIAKGTDASGSSAASLDLTARVEAAEGGLSALAGSSEASLSGKAAAFGGRMMDTVADQILKQFAANFSARVGAQQPAPVMTVASDAAHATSASSQAPVLAASAIPEATGTPAPALTPQQLDGFALLWAILRDWLRGLFSKKAA